MNKYEKPTAIALGLAHELARGTKPICLCIESEGEINRNERVDDIDEADE
jgi:hypothetical protein